MRHPLHALIAVALCAASSHAQITAPERTLVPEVSIRGVDEDWTTIGFFMVGRDGRMVVSQPRDNHLRVYGADGRLLFRFGRKGSGPGEFSVPSGMTPAQSLIGASWLGDTIVVYDQSTRRFTLVGPTGKLIRTVPLPSTLPTMSGGGDRLSAKPSVQMLSIQPFGLRPDGLLGRASYGVLREVTLANGETSRRSTTESNEVVLVGLDGQMRARVGTVRSDSVRASVIRNSPNGGVSQWGAGVPYHVAPGVTFSPYTDRVVLAWHETQHGPRGILHLVTMSARGDTLGRARLEYTAEAIPKSAVDSALASMRQSRSTSPGFPADVAAELDRQIARQVPTYYAAVTGISVGRDGLLWLRERRSESGSRAIAIEPDGRRVMSVRLPVGHSLMTGDRTHVWTVSYDADDLPIVTRFRVVGR